MLGLGSSSGYKQGVLVAFPPPWLVDTHARKGVLMVQLKNPKGTITLELDDSLTPPERAGEFTETEIQHMYKPRKGVGFVAKDCAQQIEDLGNTITLPPQFSPDNLRTLGNRAESIDGVIAEVERFLRILKQSNTVFDRDCGQNLLELRDYIEAMARNKPSLYETFKVLFNFYK